MKKLKQGSKSPSFFKVPHDVKRVQIQRVVTGRCIAKYRQVAYQNGEQNMNVKLRISWYERVEPIAVGWAWNWAFGQNRKLVPNPPLLVIDQNGAGGGGTREKRRRFWRLLCAACYEKLWKWCQKLLALWHSQTSVKRGYLPQSRLKWKIRRMKPMLERDAYAGGHVVVEEMDNVIVHKNLLFSAKTAVLGILHCKNIEHVG